MDRKSLPALARPLLKYLDSRAHYENLDGQQGEDKA
jgi:hypothetical protein